MSKGFEFRCALGSVDESASRLVGELVFGPGLVGAHVMAGDDGGGFNRRFMLVVLGDLEVAVLALGLGDPPVGNLADHALHELELPPFGGEGVGVVVEQLVAGQVA